MTSMTDNETYNGWKNRETWAFNLHWQNDQGFYNWVLEYARTLPGAYTDAEGSAYRLGEQVVNMVTEELAELSPELWELLREDVGSFWRIDYAEVGAAVRESLDNES